MKSMVKDKVSKDNEQAKNGRPDEKGGKRVSVRRSNANSGKRRSTVNNYASKGSKEEDEVNEEEMAALLEKQTIGLNKVPVISQIQRSKDGLTTVRVKMEFPFKMKDVWRELVQSKCPLDIDDEKMQSIERIRPSFERKPGLGAGYIRKVIYKNKSQTLHEIVDCVEPKLIRWRVLDAKGLPFMLRGKRMSPECTIELHPDGIGTDIEVTYVYEYATIIFPLCCFAPLVAYGIRYVLVKNLQAAWTDMMIDRGYNDRYEEMATRMQAWTKSMVERRFHRINKVGGAKKADNDDDDDDETPRKAPGKAAPSQPPPRHDTPPPRKPPGGATAAKPQPAPKSAAKATTTFTRVSRVVASDDDSESDDEIKQVDTTISPEAMRPDSPEPITSTVKIIDEDDDDDDSEEPPKPKEAGMSRPPARPANGSPTNGTHAPISDSNAVNGDVPRDLPRAGLLPPPPEGTPRVLTAIAPPASSTTSRQVAFAPVSDSRPSRPEAAPKTRPLQDPNSSLLDA